MKASLYDLAYEYTKIHMPDAGKDDKLKIIEAFKALLDKGWTSEDLMDELHLPTPAGREPIGYLRFIYKNQSPKAKNLLKTETFYWHPQLRIFPDAPKRALDYNTGEITKIEEPYFLEMRASYQLADIADYYVAQMGIRNLATGDMRRIIGALNHMLQNHNIDTMLFLIDTAANYFHEGDMKMIDSPFKITDWLYEAQQIMGAKMTDEITAGDDKIVIRKRVPVGGGRS